MTRTLAPHRGNVAIVIPALNESLRIRDVVAGALAQCERVIVVDDGSDDDTVARIADLPATVIRHPRRMGKGAALRDGFAEALRQGCVGVLTMDGDGQHRASDIPRLLDAAARHPGDIVIGARLRKRDRQPWYRRIGNDFGDWGISWGCGYRIVDTQSGQRFYPAAVAAMTDVPGDGFVFEAQLLISAARRLGSGVVAVPVESRYESADSDECFRKSHFRLFRDLYNITSHVSAQIIGHGQLLQEYQRTRARPPVIDDAEGATGMPAGLAATPGQSAS